MLMTLSTVSSSRNYYLLALVKQNLTRSSFNMSNVAAMHSGSNVVWGGAMLSFILLLLVCICYLCHWRIHKNEARYEDNSWMHVAESETPVHIFTLDQQCYDRSELFQETDEHLDISPPTYEEIFENYKSGDSERDDPDLPSYETAMSLSSQGHI